ncbi:MAG: hypothetical protein WD929_00415 [Steroidobacteraceae bacterium]
MSITPQLRAATFIEGIESEQPVINCTTCHRGQKKPAISLDPTPAGLRSQPELQSR